MAVFIHCNLKHITFTFELIRNIEIVKELVLLFFLFLIFCFVSLGKYKLSEVCDKFSVREIDNEVISDD